MHKGYNKQPVSYQTITGQKAHEKNDKVISRPARGLWMSLMGATHVHITIFLQELLPDYFSEAFRLGTQGTGHEVEDHVWPPHRRVAISSAQTGTSLALTGLGHRISRHRVSRRLRAAWNWAYRPHREMGLTCRLSTKLTSVVPNCATWLIIGTHVGTRNVSRRKQL